MSGAPTTAGSFAPMPQAPTAQAPVGISADGAARSAWAPNVFTWVLTWRALICAELVVAIVAGLAGTDAVPVLVATLAWTACSVAPALWPPSGAVLRRAVLLVDLVACIALLAMAPDDTTLSLLAAYACSTAVSWAAGRPIDAFVAGGACSAAFVAIVLLGDASGDGRPAGITGTLSLFVFFSLATSGFFTVAHRIGALEIATEISRERGRYRRDLHDRLGQALSGMHFEVQAVHAVGRDEHASSRLRSLADGYRDALRMLRDLFRVGDEPMVGTNVASVIRQEARRMGQQAGVRIGVETTGDASRVPPWMRPHVVAVAGECVNNAVKNGHAGGIDITLDVTEELLVLSITDDGVGFDNPPGTITEKEGHYGLREMAERARICGGEVVIASQVGFGTRVRLQAPIPLNASEDVLERDASQLRSNVWTLLLTLRTALGVVAIAQLLVALARGTGPAAATWVLLALVAADVLVVAARSNATQRLLERSAAPVLAYAVAVGAVVAFAMVEDVAPVVLLYAPLALLGVGVANGRHGAAYAAWTMLASVVVACTLVELAGELSDAELRAALVHVTDIALLGMAAVQGAKLLDRLEVLQINVRHQALARLKQGLSSRMRDQLTERLEELERHTRALADDTPDGAEFTRATSELVRESTELKQRLRDIVHTLADPTPTQGRTTAHV